MHRKRGDQPLSLTLQIPYRGRLGTFYPANFTLQCKFRLERPPSASPPRWDAFSLPFDASFAASRSLAAIQPASERSSRKNRANRTRRSRDERLAAFRWRESPANWLLNCKRVHQRGADRKQSRSFEVNLGRKRSFTLPGYLLPLCSGYSLLS